MIGLFRIAVAVRAAAAAPCPRSRRCRPSPSGSRSSTSAKTSRQTSRIGRPSAAGCLAAERRDVGVVVEEREVAGPSRATSRSARSASSAAGFSAPRASPRGWPSGVASQSWARINRLTSLSPGKMSSKIFVVECKPGSHRAWLVVLYQSRQRRDRAPGTTRVNDAPDGDGRGYREGRRRRIRNEPLRLKVSAAENSVAGGPGLIVAGRLGPAAAGQRRAGRPVGRRRPGHVRHDAAFPIRAACSSLRSAATSTV